MVFRLDSEVGRFKTFTVQQYQQYTLEEPGYSFSSIGPVDWLREAGIRLDELAASDLVFCDKTDGPPDEREPPSITRYLSRGTLRRS